VFRVRAACMGSLLAALGILAGCGGDPSMAEVRGSVTFDNNPIEKGSITFFPIDGKTKTAGCQIKDGQYVAQVPVGTMKVSISVPKVVGKVPLFDTPGSKMRDIIEEVLPPQYNEETTLRLDVTPGKVEKDFELRSDGR